MVVKPRKCIPVDLVAEGAGGAFVDRLLDSLQVGATRIDPRLYAAVEDFAQIVRACPGVRTAATIVVNRDTLAQSRLDPQLTLI